MTEQAASLKTAAVCMVYNGCEYLSEFLHYYLNLCDHIFLIDHNSQRDLRQLKLDRVTVVRSNHEAQFQSECTNLVIEHFDLKADYDWLFVLDIDEFLPFKHQKHFHDFLHQHQHHSVLQFHWRNGVPFYDEASETPQSLIDCKSIRFFHHHGIQHKSFVNTKKTKGRFFVPTGAHHISRIMPAWQSNIPFLKNRKNYIPFIVDIPLFHIIAFNKNTFVKKIKNYVEQMKYREHITGQGGWMVRDYPDDFSGDEWLWYIANFRVSNPDDYYDVRPEYFLEDALFDHLDPDAVLALRTQIQSFQTTDKQAALAQEKQYLSFKKDDRDVMDNIQWFQINAHNEIITIIPEAHSLREEP